MGICNVLCEPQSDPAGAGGLLCCSFTVGSLLIRLIEEIGFWDFQKSKNKASNTRRVPEFQR